MIYRTFDPTIHNRIGNIPSVRETIGRHAAIDGPIDFSDCAARPLDYILLTDGNGAAALFQRRGPVVCEVHVLFDPSCRGRKAKVVMAEMLDWIFTNTKTLIITAGIPTHPDWRKTRIFAAQLGFVADGREMVRNDYWHQEHAYYHLTRQDHTGSR